MSQHAELLVAEGNRPQLAAWDGDEGAYWAEHADLFDASIREHHRRFLEAARIDVADRVLDVGCGTGQTSLDAARRAVRGSVLGVDLSTEMLRVAAARASEDRVGNVSFIQADAQVHAFASNRFDRVISRTGVIFFSDLRAGLSNLRSATRPGGGLALLAWQPPARNEWFTTFTGIFALGRTLPFPPPGAPGPFALSDPQRILEILSASGWQDVDVQASEAPMYFGADTAVATAFVSGLFGWLLADVDQSSRVTVLSQLDEAIAVHRSPAGVAFDSATWVVTARR